MDDLTDKVAFITGGAGGIGLAMAKAFLREGMHVAIADVDAQALNQAEAELAGSNARVLAVQLDVTNREQFQAVADEVEQTLGAVHVLCNNAGVYRGGTLDKVTYEDWDWLMGVNLGGVINGLQTLINRIKAHGQGGHIVNTASMAGVTASSGMGVYNSSKFAVVGLSEALRDDLAPHNIGVSVLCPGMVRTGILHSERNRPEQYEARAAEAEAAAREQIERMHTAMNAGIDAGEVADVVVQGVKTNQFYLFPHPELKASVVGRQEELLAAFGEPNPERLAAMEEFLGGLLKT